MTCTCRNLHPSTSATWTATVPEWVHMAEVSSTDEEPCLSEWGHIGPCERFDPQPEPRGRWLGCLLLVAAFVAGFVLGRLT